MSNMSRPPTLDIHNHIDHPSITDYATGSTTWFKQVLNAGRLNVAQVLFELNKVQCEGLYNTDIRSLKKMLDIHRKDISLSVHNTPSIETFHNDNGIMECMTQVKSITDLNDTFSLVFPVVYRQIFCCMVSFRGYKTSILDHYTHDHKTLYFSLTPHSTYQTESPFIQFCEVIDRAYRCML